MKSVHIFNYTPHHFKSLVPFFNNIDKGTEFYIFKNNNLYLLNTTSLEVGSVPLKLNPSTMNISSIIIHGLWDIKLWYYVFRMNISKHIVWVAWGADIYHPSTTVVNKVKNFIFKAFNNICIRNFKAVIALNKGDSLVLQSLTNHKSIKVLPYPLDSKIELLAKSIDSNIIGSKVKVLLGNSGASTNNHFELLKKLAHFNSQKIEIICPLGYGGESDYISKVAQFGRDIFGHKFKPLLKVMDQTDYYKLLQDIDVLIFDHSRQQGLFNIYYFLFSKKKIFINENSTTYNDFKDMGIELNVTSDLEMITYEQFKKFDVTKIQSNYTIFNSIYSKSILELSWKKLLNELN